MRALDTGRSLVCQRIHEGHLVLLRLTVSESDLIVGPAHDRQRGQEPDGEHQRLLFMLVKAATHQLLDEQGKCGLENGL